jgi:hypothetical protein
MRSLSPSSSSTPSSLLTLFTTKDSFPTTVKLGGIRSLRVVQIWVAAGAHRRDESDSDGEAKHKLYVEERGTFALLTSSQSWSIRDDVRAETSEKDNRQWVREYIDGEWLRDWLRLSESGLSDDTKFSLTQDLQDLRVIDVSSVALCHSHIL